MCNSPNITNISQIYVKNAEIGCFPKTTQFLWHRFREQPSRIRVNNINTSVSIYNQGVCIISINNAILRKYMGSSYIYVSDLIDNLEYYICFVPLDFYYRLINIV